MLWNGEVALEAKEKITDLAEAIGTFYNDPLGYVYFAFPWGKPGLLQDEEGPDKWQVDVLRKIASGVDSGKAVQVAVASGHGVGKTALVSWIIQWFISTRPHCQVVVTANTENQLTTKTWRELSKWHKLSVNKDWFIWTATKFYQKDHPSTWFASAIPWNEDKTEAFAGTHDKDMLMLFDEASAIPDGIWTSAQGAMTTKGAMWCVFGNPTRNTGRFRECWGKFKHRWETYQVDSRTAKQADKKQLNEWVEDYGEDSDFVRVRIRGVFPRAGSKQFIPSDIVRACRGFKSEGHEVNPKIMAIDVARFGDDQSVFAVRQGRKLDELIKYRGLDTMELASQAAEFINRESPDYIIIDANGVGAGVADRLKQIGHRDLIEITGSERAYDPMTYFNHRAENWGRMKDWLKAGAEIPDDNELEEQLIAPEYEITNKSTLQLESKEHMKRRGADSPDCADAVAMTFSLGTVVPLKNKGNDRYKRKPKYREHSWMAR